MYTVSYPVLIHLKQSLYTSTLSIADFIFFIYELISDFIPFSPNLIANHTPISSITPPPPHAT